MKKYILTLFVISFIVPSIALASWYNPFSWFRKSANETQKIEVPVPETTSNPVLPIKTISTPKSEEHKIIYDTKTAEKPVTQTITVQDPTLQRRIQQLELENQQLKLQIEKLNNLQQLVQTQKEEIESLKSVPVFSKDKECEEAKEFINSIGERVTDLRERQAKEIADYMKNEIKLQKDIDAIKNKYRVEGSQIDREIKSAKNKIELYCI
ncbi:hypothetical protein A3A95_00620 [Candidatus Nomurabacteria bacterium RIFCSPLOWO2_01_FULL_39_18]|uniref:Uncharacterized protein n=1 Tax=Candidatus Nomurabacteria bacterium RIFCSPHIGHO2_01_FULL_40_24b TaxID=1801739 RepID=A0A1F6V8B2_9BACT|nr:MAG: hypothetical protein A2647_01540 [Candidatus Nomurabacteria bacterium RIFCSPHIGHO2_01_FULL_40_24b]OGI89795.1 MAG: hypothetical protein A3A95_00620 [Candidatus Nomurabacteria bacterium RIFCSPLOWO2_01_FULL_39_18]